MKYKKTFLINLLLSFFGFLFVLTMFWWAGANVLPIGGSSFKGDARIIKPWIILDSKPKTLLVTNSRGVYGYNPSFIKEKNIYNGSMVGLGVNEVFRIVKHSYYGGAGNEHFYIGLDDICDIYKETLDSSFYDSDYLTSPPDLFHNIKRVRAILGSPFDIMRNVMKSDGGTNSYGFRLFFPDNNYHSGGVAKSLQKREQLDYSNIVFADDCDKSAFKEMLNFLYKHRLNFTLFMNPIHVRNYIAYEFVGKFESYISIVESIDIINRDVAKTFDTAPAKVCFFNEINKVTTESFYPAKLQFDPMTYWYENSHFKEKYGNEILNKLLKDGACQSNVQRQIEHLRHSTADYIVENPTTAAEVKNVIKGLTQ